MFDLASQVADVQLPGLALIQKVWQQCASVQG